jgi:hypothetical protein
VWRQARWVIKPGGSYHGRNRQGEEARMNISRWARCGAAVALVLTAACTGATPDPDADLRLADRDAIQATIDRYIRGLDRLDTETYLSAWTEDSEISLYGEDVHSGHEALAEYIVNERAARATAQEKGAGFVQFHQLSNQRIEFTGPDTAEHRAYWTASRRDAAGKIEIAFIGRLVDQVVRRDGEWLLQRREVLSEP